MRWEILTKEINDMEWVVGSKFDSEKLDPETPRHLSRSLKNYADENGKPKLIFDDGNLIEKQWEYTEEELQNIKQKRERTELRNKYSRDEELEIQRRAIDKLALGEKLPAEYVEYRKAVDEARQKAQEEVQKLKILD